MSAADFDELAVHRYVGARLVDPADRPAGVRFTVHEGIEGRPGFLNAGIISMLIDSAAYLALEPLLDPDEDAVTHNITVSVLRPVARGEEVLLRGRVLQRGRRVAFLDADATVDGRVVASARVVKTVIRRP